MGDSITPLQRNKVKKLRNCQRVICSLYHLKQLIALQRYVYNQQSSLQLLSERFPEIFHFDDVTPSNKLNSKILRNFEVDSNFL